MLSTSKTWCWPRGFTKLSFSPAQRAIAASAGLGSWESCADNSAPPSWSKAATCPTPREARLIASSVHRQKLAEGDCASFAGTRGIQSAGDGAD